MMINYKEIIDLLSKAGQEKAKVEIHNENGSQKGEDKSQSVGNSQNEIQDMQTKPENRNADDDI